ncbi:MAG: PAS domain S-box protein [Armatimonadetes bacterium]|nr:PAS domain S-box protein [Armatimonadota bacterium]
MSEGGPDARPPDDLRPAWLSDAVDQAADLVFLTDDRDRFVYVNRRAIDLLGTPPTKLVGEPVVAVVAPEAHARILDALQAARLGDPSDTQVVECAFVAKHAPEPVPLEITLRCVTVRRHRRGCVAVARSVVAREDSLSQLLASERVAAIGDLANQAADRINNPLAVLVTHAGVIERAAREGKPAGPESLEQMRNAITRIADVTEELSTIADTSIQKLLLGRPIADIGAAPNHGELSPS